MTTAKSVNEVMTQPPAVPHKRGAGFYVKRGLLALIALLLALPILGFSYETIMRAGDDGRFPARGQMIDVDGHLMHLHCTGEGSPTVILEAGAADYSLSWTLVQPALSETARVCSYDRAGFGWSEPGPEPRSPQQIATELHTLLANAGIAAPYVLVGQSNGGKYVRMFASLYPDEVVGMVLEDARHESMEPEERSPEQNEKDREAYRSSLQLYAILGRLGVARLFGVSLLQSSNPPVKNLPTEIQAEMALIAVQQDTLDTMVTEGSGGMDNDAQLTAAVLDDMPLVVLTADSSVKAEPRWEQAQQALAALSTNRRWTTVENADHMIHWVQPAIVIEAVLDVIEATKTGEPLTP
jgi:pimeloyl-ACP methyl ester carboxylesterase